MNDKLFEIINNQTIYRVPVHKGPIIGTVEVPGSKSITNRALLLAALATGKSKLTGVLFSDESRHFISSLISLGFDVSIDECSKTVIINGNGGIIPKRKATINVGSAGTAARFLTTLLAFSDGEYIIECSDQMKKRPMKPLFDALSSMGAYFEYLDKNEHLPVKIKGSKRCDD